MDLGWKGRAGIILYTTLSSLTGLGFREKIIQTPLFSTCKLQKGKPEEKEVPQSSILSGKKLTALKKVILNGTQNLTIRSYCLGHHVLDS